MISYFLLRKRVHALESLMAEFMLLHQEQVRSIEFVFKTLEVLQDDTIKRLKKELDAKVVDISQARKTTTKETL